MGPTRQVVRRAASRVGRSSLGDVAGRAVNLILPFLLLAAETIGESLDGFFLALAVAFFVQGTLSNAVTLALVPELVAHTHPSSLRRFAAASALAGLLAALVVAAMDRGSLPAPLGMVQMGAVAVMAGVGLLAAPAVAALNAAHRYLMPGLTWGLRLLPLALYLALARGSRDLAWLLAGLAMADSARTLVLLWLARQRVTLSGGNQVVQFPASTLYLIGAAAVAGLSPLIARWIAALGEAGGVSIFEAADRLYSALASLATLGVSSVILVYLARLTGTPEEGQGWRWILGASLIWSLAWLAVSIGIWVILPFLVPFLESQGDEAIKVIRDTFLALALGLPALIMSGVLGRRLVTLGHSQSLVPMAAAGVICVAGVGILLRPALGTLGIGISLSLSQFLVAILLVWKLAAVARQANGDHP